MGFCNKLFGKGQNVKQAEHLENKNQNELNPLIDNYISGLKNAYFKHKGKEEWEFFETVIHGAKSEHINILKQVYPEIPSTLINLLQYVDGTYWRKYGNNTITFFMLGSDMHEYPYFLLSSKEIIENQNLAKECFSKYIERTYEDVEVDDKIIDKAESINWLHFSDCTNNGGTSQLFIDFSPSDKGTNGQVVRYLHDPDELKVIADSFEAYLQMIISREFDFINEDTFE
ncbi:MAG: SMI1/KNR4 family protein [Aquaticitalea sp.]